MTEKSYIEKIKEIRSNYNKAFKNSPDSPLTDEQKQNFKSLSYFPINEKYKLIVKLEKNPNPDEIIIFSSKGDERQFLRYGFFEFELDGENNKLTVFKPPDADYLFLPFKDKTAGSESHGAGRYVDIELTSDEKYLIDFNLAYNPLCAYNDNFNCALTPFENVLSISIPAGQKKFQD